MELLLRAPNASVTVEIIPGCTVCGLCEAQAPRVFNVTDRGVTLRPEGRSQWGRFVDDILNAADLCPSGAIRVTMTP